MNDNYSDLDHGYRGIFDVTMKEMMGGSGTRENQCINYVVEMYLKMLYQFSEAIFFYNHIENLPDKILDYLAIEWDLPYYEDSLDRDTKVRLVKEGFNWRRTAGTVYGVETLVKKMFGEGKGTSSEENREHSESRQMLHWFRTWRSSSRCSSGKKRTRPHGSSSSTS